MLSGSNMKRSEMIDKIAEHVHDAIEIYAGTKEVRDKFFAQKILNMIENKGMMPPFNHEEYLKTWRDGGSGYKWEQE